MRPLSIYTSIKPAYAGISLRGSCLTKADIQALEHGFNQLALLSGNQLWVDCRHLESLNYQGQRAILWADNLARTKGITLLWCGLPAGILTQLSESGLGLLLHLLPVTAYQGPAELVTARL